MVESRGQVGRRPKRAEAKERPDRKRTGRGAGRVRGAGFERGTENVPGAEYVRGAALVAVAATLAIGLTSCAGTPDPAPNPPVSTATATPSSPTTPSPDVPPAVAVPERPAAMDRDDAEGAIAAATYFISLYSYAYATGELSEWQAMSDPECVFCAGLTTDVQGAIEGGTRFVGGEMTITSSAASAAQADSIFRVDLIVTQAPYEEIDESGAVTSSGPGTKSATVTAALQHGPTWIVHAATTEVLVK